MGLDIKVIQEQVKSLITQRDNASQIFQQCVGAISILSEQLNLLSLDENEKKGDELNGQIIDRKPEEAA